MFLFCYRGHGVSVTERLFGGEDVGRPLLRPWRLPPQSLELRESLLPCFQLLDSWYLSSQLSSWPVAEGAYQLQDRHELSWPVAEGASQLKDRASTTFASSSVTASCPLVRQTRSDVVIDVLL